MRQKLIIFLILLLTATEICANIIAVQIAASGDDAVELIGGRNDGRVTINDDRLRIQDNKKIGVRFQNIAIPQGSQINSASIQFTAYSNQRRESSTTIVGEDSDHAEEYSNTSQNISNRTETSESVLWTIPGWSTNDNNDAQKVTGLKNIVQEIVNRVGWQSGKAMAFMLKEGSGREKQAYAWDKSSANSAELFIDFTPPLLAMSEIPDQSVRNGKSFTMSLSDYISGEATSYTLESGTLPTGLDFNTVTGLIDGAATTNGDYTLSVYASNATERTDTRTFTITVSDVALVLNMRMDECAWVESDLETVQDSSGNGIYGSISNGINTGKYGIVNRRGIFNDPGIVSTQNDPKLTLEEVTSTAWIYPETMPSSNGALRTILSKDKNYEYHIINDNGTYRIFWWWQVEDAGTTTTYHYNSDIGLESDKWYFIAISYRDGEQHLYVKSLDGTVNSDTVRNYTGTLKPDNSGGIEIGGDRNIDSRIFDGKIDEVKVFDGVLDSSEIDVIFSNEINNKNYDGTDRAPVECSFTDPWPVVEYRMDECYWAGNGSMDVVDSSVTGLNGEALTGAQSTDTVLSDEFKLCMAANVTSEDAHIGVSDDPAINNFDKNITVMAWIYPVTYPNWAVAVAKTNNSAWNNGWGLVHLSDTDEVGFFVNNYSSNVASGIVPTGEWTHIAGVYDGNKIYFYINGDKVSEDDFSDEIDNSTQVMMIGNDASDEQWDGYIDEVKVYDKALDLNQIRSVYNYERGGFNFNGSERACKPCNASISANTWEMISIPAESREVPGLGVQDVFGDDFEGNNYDAGDVNGWILWRRDYNIDDNFHTYHKVDYENNELIDFNKGYWLGSIVEAKWDVNNIQAVDYNSIYNGTEHCVASRCVEIDLEPVAENGMRYNLSNFPGRIPVAWEKCRFIISDSDGSNVEVLPPAAADEAGYVSRTISIWPGGQGSGSGGQVVENDYTECHDETPGGCNLLPYHSVWIQVLTPTLNKKIKLLIPEE